MIFHHRSPLSHLHSAIPKLGVNNYQDLNKAWLKDDFPLPHIDVLIENVANYTMYSFMDGFFGYNQILMNIINKAKMSNGVLTVTG